MRWKAERSKAVRTRPPHMLHVSRSARANSRRSASDLGAGAEGVASGDDGAGTRGDVKLFKGACPGMRRCHPPLVGGAWALSGAGGGASPVDGGERVFYSGDAHGPRVLVPAFPGRGWGESGVRGRVTPG